MVRCPSTLRLEMHLQTPDASGLAGHVESCERCREELRQMRCAGDEFRDVVYPRTVEALLDRLERTGRN